MDAKSWKPPALYVAFDPGATTGIAWKRGGEPVRSMAAGGITLDSVLNTLDRETPFAVLVLVERMGTRWRRAAAHNADANKIVRAVKKHWAVPRGRCRVITVPPKEWQAATVSNAPGDTPKARSIFAANMLREATGSDRRIEDDNEADAYNQLFYLMTSPKFAADREWAESWSVAPPRFEVGETVFSRKSKSEKGVPRQSVVIEKIAWSRDDNEWIYGFSADGRQVSQLAGGLSKKRGKEIKCAR